MVNKRRTSIGEDLSNAYFKASRFVDDVFGDSGFIVFREIKPELVSWFVVFFGTILFSSLLWFSYGWFVSSLPVLFFLLLNWSFWNGKVRL